MRPVRHPSIRTPAVCSALLSLSLLLAPAAFAQGTDDRQGPQGESPAASANPEARQRDLVGPDVKQSLAPDPTPQGTRPPEELTPETSPNRLHQALAAVRNAPPGLDGKPIPRPNIWASEPDVDSEPTRSADPSDLTSREVK